MLYVFTGFIPFSRTVWLSLKHTADAFQLPSFSWVMESFDIVEDICARFSPGAILSAIYSLALEHAKEAFRHCIVGTTAHRTHAANQIVPLQEALVLVTGKLTAAI
jgi:hypothetical protein